MLSRVALAHGGPHREAWTRGLRTSVPGVNPLHQHLSSGSGAEIPRDPGFQAAKQGVCTCAAHALPAQPREKHSCACVRGQKPRPLRGSLKSSGPPPPALPNGKHVLFFFCLFFRATPAAYGGGSQARDQIRAVAASLHHSSQPCRALNPLSEARDQTRNLMAPNRICFHCAMTGTPRF